MSKNIFVIFKEEYNKIMLKVILYFKRVYVISFNVYAYYWLYREIFIRKTTDFETYLLFGFILAGMYFFVLSNKDIYFSINHPKNQQHIKHS